MFAYCLNNPVSYSDASGKFVLSAFIGAVVGGVIGGAIISTVSYAVNCAINGQELTAGGLVNATITGALTGAIGAAIGTISLAAPAATIAVKAVASAVVGIGMGIKTGLETEGSLGKKWITGFITGIATAGSTYLGSRIDAYDAAFGFAGNVFTNSAVTFFVGVPTEIVSVGTQQGINNANKAARTSDSPASRLQTAGRVSVLHRALAC